jgi:hypothetical protein
MASAVTPKPDLRARVLQAVDSEAGLLQSRGKSIPFPFPSGTSQESPQATNPERPGGKARTLQFAQLAAAMLILLAGVGFILQWQQQKDLEKQILGLNEELNFQKENASELQHQLELNNNQLAILRDASTRRIMLLALNGIGTSRVDVYWNAQRQASYFDILELPAAPPGKQYQLWAIVDGTPVDMGVIPLNAGPESWQSFPFVEAPQAFAITLEREGGSPQPSLDQMVVIGSV